MYSTNSSTLSTPSNIEPNRVNRLQSELGHAWSQLARKDMLAWDAASGFDFFGAATRQVRDLAHFAKSSALFGGKEEAIWW